MWYLLWGPGIGALENTPVLYQYSMMVYAGVTQLFDQGRSLILSRYSMVKSGVGSGHLTGVKHLLDKLGRGKSDQAS